MAARQKWLPPHQSDNFAAILFFFSLCLRYNLLHCVSSREVWGRGVGGVDLASWSGTSRRENGPCALVYDTHAELEGSADGTAPMLAGALDTNAVLQTQGLTTRTAGEILGVRKRSEDGGWESEGGVGL